MSSLEVGPSACVREFPVSTAFDDGRQRPARSRSSLRTKERLIIAAVDLAAGCGFSNLNLRAVVERAGCLNISAIHYHFRCRQAFLAAILEKIDALWPARVPDYAQRQGAGAILHEFWLGLDDLGRAARWEASVVRFLARLVMDDDPETADQATAFLATRLNLLFDALAKHYPGVAANMLRLRLANACLLLLNVKGNLHQRCITAVGSGRAEALDSSISEEVLAMAVSLVAGPQTASPPLPATSNVVPLRAQSGLTADPADIADSGMGDGSARDLPDTHPETAHRVPPSASDSGEGQSETAARAPA